MIRKSLLTVPLVIFLTIGLQAQNIDSFPRSEISIGPEYAIPVGDFKGNNGIGGSVKYIYHFNKGLGLSLQAGAIRYDFTSWPVKLGGHFRYKGLFVEPQLGLTYFSGRGTNYQNGATTYGVNVGGYIAKRVVVSGNFERWNKGGFGASHVGIRLAYAIFLRRTDSVRRAKPETQTAVYTYDRNSEDWKKHKTFKTLGWVAIGVGLPVTFTGFVVAIASAFNSNIKWSTGAWLMGTGAAVTVASIPLFTLAHKYKKKARHPAL